MVRSQESPAFQCPLSSQGGQPLPSALLSGCFSTLVINSVFVSPLTQAPGRLRVRVWGRGCCRGGGQTRRVGGGDGQEQLVDSHEVCSEGMGPFDYSVDPEHSSRLGFQVRKPEFLRRCGGTFRMASGASRILGHGVRCLKEAAKRIILWTSSFSAPQASTYMCHMHMCTHVIYDLSA